MLRLIMSARVRERNNLLRLAELVGIQNNQTIIREIFSELCRQTFKRRIVRDRPPTGGNNYQQMVEIDLSCQ